MPSKQPEEAQKELDSSLLNPRNLKVADFLERPLETWQYLLEVSQVQWNGKIDSKFVNQLLREKYNEALHRYQDQSTSFVLTSNTAANPSVQGGQG